MSSVGYTVNPITGRKIKIGSSMYNKLTKYFFIDENNNILNQTKPVGNYSQYGENLKPYSRNIMWDKEREKKVVKRVRVENPDQKGKYVYVGSKRWNELYKKYDWDGKNKRFFSNMRSTPLNKYEGSVKSRREFRKHTSYYKDIITDELIKKGEILNSELGYSVVYYNNELFEERNGVPKEFHAFKVFIGKVYTMYDVRVIKKEDNKIKLYSNTEINKFKTCSMFNVFIDKECEQFKKQLKYYISRGLKDAPQYLISLKATDLFDRKDPKEIKIDEIKKDSSDDVTLNVINDTRKPSERILNKDHIDEWIEKYIKYYKETLEDLELMGSGFYYVGNTGCTITMIPLKVHVGAAIPTPSILGKCVLNPNIDDNKCLQRSLILACDGDYFVETRHVSILSSYNKYWKKEDKNLIFDHKMSEIEKAVNIENDTPFVACEENFMILEKLLNVHITCYQFYILDGFKLDDVSSENYEKFTLEPIYPLDDIERVNRPDIYLCILNDDKKNIKHFVYIRDPSAFRNHIMKASDTQNRHNSRHVQCRWCIFSGPKSVVLKHEIRCHEEFVPEEDKYILDTSNNNRLTWTNQRYQMTAPVVLYADFESSIDNEKRHKPIMLSVARVSRIPNVSTEYKVFRGPNECAADFTPFLDYLVDTKNAVIDELFDESKMIVTPEVESDYEKSKKCPFCNCNLCTKDEIKQKIERVKSIEQKIDERKKYYEKLQEEEDNVPIVKKFYEAEERIWNDPLDIPEDQKEYIEQRIINEEVVNNMKSLEENLEAKRNIYKKFFDKEENLPYYKEYHEYMDAQVKEYIEHYEEEREKELKENEPIRDERFKIAYDKYCIEWENVYKKKYEQQESLYNQFYEEACEHNRQYNRECWEKGEKFDLFKLIDADLYAKEKTLEVMERKIDSMDSYAIKKANEEIGKWENSEPVKEIVQYKERHSRMLELEHLIHTNKATRDERDEYKILAGSRDTNYRTKVRHHAHIEGDYYDGNELKHYKAGEYICTCCSKCNMQLSFNKNNYKLPVFFHNGSRYDNSFIMRIIGKYKSEHPKCKLEVIPTAMDKEMLITFNGIDFKDSYKMISNSLKNIVNQTLGSDLNNYPITKQLLKQYLEDHNKEYKEDFIELMTRKEPMFYSLVTSYKTLENKRMPKLDECYDELSNTFMSAEDYNHMKLLWKTFKIQNWGEYYELYNILDVTLLADAFEHFRNSTYHSFGVDAAHYLTTPQMSYSLFLKNISNEDTSRFAEEGVKWAAYQMKIGANEGYSEVELGKLFVKRMNQFYEDGGIRLLSKRDMSTFISLKDNLRGGITQISTRYASVDIEKNEEKDSIFYLDANNLYGGTMHRMMPYDIVRVYQKELDSILNANPEEWIKSLKTFDQYGYFIECDITCPNDKHDFFNDLPLFPRQELGTYSESIKEFAKKNGIVDLINEKEKTKKLICDLYPKQHYVVHYSMLQLGLQLGYHVEKIHNVIKFKQAPFIFEYVNKLSSMRAQSKTAVLKNLFKLLANSIYGKFVETGLKRMKVKIATNKKEQDAIITKYSTDLIDDMQLYDENIWAARLFNPVKRMSKPFFIGFAILDMSKYIIYDFYYNKLKKMFNNVTLLGQDTDSLIVKIRDENTVEKMLDIYKSFDFSELDTSSYFYQRLVEYYNNKVNKSEFPSLNSFVNYNKKVAGPIFKDEHQGHRITEFCGLRPKLYCILDEKSVIHNAAKGVPRSVYTSTGEMISIKNMELYKRILFPKTQKDAVLSGDFKRIANSHMNINTVSQSKVLFTCLDNKRFIRDDNIHTYAFGNYHIVYNA